ncbi:hypothetical protein LOAG_06489 [Loa loa]|uniref:Uncharacterized protein n=1 Tax=Loa loa TaxID=7209 RepID=A0A1S0TYC1_LOALO|nr:hypothetical protein LOAG_06489 [Loa loa]EFO21997.1 hypothetical protein LOAG_06489 [Loa loa]
MQKNQREWETGKIDRVRYYRWYNDVNLEFYLSSTWSQIVVFGVRSLFTERQRDLPSVLFYINRLKNRVKMEAKGHFVIEDSQIAAKFIRLLFD